MKKVAIVGAGPAGLFAAYKLAGKVALSVIDRGKDIEKRKCYVSSKGKCAKCNPCNIIYGVGGAGLFSDGKLIFDTNIGSNLKEIVEEKKNSGLVKEVEKIFSDYGIKTKKGESQKITMWGLTILVV